MLLTHIRIKNFRSLKDFGSPLEKFTVIIGENDVGKTSILYALQIFFQNKKITNETDYFAGKKDNAIEISLDIEGMQDHPTLQDHCTSSGIVTVKRVFEFSQEPHSIVIDENRNEIKLSKTEVRKLFPDEAFHFVPVTRTLAEQFSMKKTALLGKTFRRLMKETVSDPEHEGTLEGICSILESSIDPARKSLQGLLREQLNNESVNLNFQNLNIDPIEGVSFEWTVDDSQMEAIPLSQRGAGTQNSMILALYRFIASGITSDFILALEEPENSFHPKGQREMLSVLHRMSEKNQVICTTHSPVFIDRVDFRSNIILVRQPDGAAVAKSLDPERFEEVRQLLGIRPSDALLKGGGNCSIIAEGRSEEQAFPRFMRICGINDRQLGISVLPVGCNSPIQVEGYIKLLNSYGLNCFVVLDEGVPRLEDLERLLINSQYPSFKGLHVLEKGSLEDYYPIELLKEAVKTATDGKVFPTSERAVSIRMRQISPFVKLLSFPPSVC